MSSNIVSHVASRARYTDQILEYANKHNIKNEMLIKVGLRMNGNLLFGSNQRCVAMLIAFKSIMDDVSSSSSLKPLTELQDRLKQALNFLDLCRPLSVSMTNAANILREEINRINTAHMDQAIANLRLKESSKAIERKDFGTSDRQLHQEDINDDDDLCKGYNLQKAALKKFIDKFIEEEIWSAQRGICENISSNIANNDVILVYGCSTIVQNVLLHSKTRGISFKVIVVDSPPHFNGRRMTSFLNDNSIDVSYTLINSLSFVMRLATKVLLGANSMLANGYVMSHIGTSQVALMAKASNVPALVCCETYKLSDRVYVDSFGCNEVDSGGHELESALSLRYDLTPPELVSMVINEKSSFPANSVPALLRFRAERTKTA